MKKYLMMAFAAVAMASCSNHDVAQLSQAEIDKAKYDQAFLRYVGGSIDANQDWGFSATRSNQGETYAQTHGDENGGCNMNHNEWADPDKEFGGWVVPDALTEGQKLRVKAYFQANPNLTFEDPELRHFFVQQVYKGGSDKGANSAENIVAADNSVATSADMNLLTVGESHIHINDFNAGDCSESDVLNNGQAVGGTSHKDKITLMVNIDDTSCFGYHETASSTHHDNKAALVSAAVIDAWAAANGNPGEAVTDKWNRSFLGFDLALQEGEQAYAKDDDGKVIYAAYDQAPESPEYAWDGEKIIRLTTGEYETVTKDNGYGYKWTENVPIYKDEYKSIMGVGYLTTNENFYVAGEKVTLDQTFSINRAQLSTLTEAKNSVVLKEVMDGDQWYQSVVNLQKIKQLVEDGYLPVKDKSLTEWVQVGKSDGYFTDWIVTLTEAQRQGDDLRIIAEDLSATEASDFDFNDIVLDVTYGNPAKVVLVAAGGTLPLCINMDEELEVHKLFDVDVTEMVNTGKGPDLDAVDLTDKLNVSIANAAEAKDKLRLWVKKNGEWQEMTAPMGEPACKLAVDKSFTILKERQSIKAEYPLFVEWATAPGNSFTSKWW